MKFYIWWLRLCPKNRRVYLWILGVYFFNWTLLVRCIPDAIAQIIPDEMLDVKRTQVTPPIGNTRQIEGGAIRKSYLFHSFDTFTIQENQRVDFNVPRSIDTIFSRVTGGTRTDILGTLGVNGDADFCLLNPAGIIFGPNARLNIAGSFVASTGDRVTFTDGSSFNAIAPNLPPLLSVNVVPELQLGAGRSPITNDAQLIIGGGLVLHGIVRCKRYRSEKVLTCCIKQGYVGRYQM